MDIPESVVHTKLASYMYISIYVDCIYLLIPIQSPDNVCAILRVTNLMLIVEQELLTFS